MKPLKYWYITQDFGKNPQIYNQFGLAGHNGIDLRCSVGTELYATKRMFLERQNDGTGGYGLNLRGFTDTDEQVFGHLSEILRNGWVDEGEVIALTGNTGFSTGPHLHWGFRYRDGFKGSVKDYNNGFKGYINQLNLDWEDTMPEQCFASRAMVVLKIKELLIYIQEKLYNQPPVTDAEYQKVAEIFADDNINLTRILKDQVKTDFFKYFMRKIDCQKSITDLENEQILEMKENEVAIEKLNKVLLDYKLNLEKCMEQKEYPPEINDLSAGELLAKAIRKFLGIK